MLNNNVKEIDEGLESIGKRYTDLNRNCDLYFEGRASTLSFVLIYKSTATTAADDS